MGKPELHVGVWNDGGPALRGCGNRKSISNRKKSLVGHAFYRERWMESLAYLEGLKNFHLQEELKLQYLPE